ncbi:MAG: PD40 domain-containing protein [Planctomycetes bacterium]|nr:PD40 domain-containing protein [Planctomycetota bacterium]
MPHSSQRRASPFRPLAVTAASLVIATVAHGQSLHTRLSNAPNGDPADRDCNSSQFSADGRWIVFTSSADNLVPNPAPFEDVFAYDRTTGVLALISRSSSDEIGNHRSESPSISADGRFVVFSSYATNLVPGDTNGYVDVFLRDRDPDEDGLFDEPGCTTTRVSLAADGSQGNLESSNPSMSGDGNLIVFNSRSTQLVPDDQNGQFDVFLRDLANGTLERISVGAGGVEGNNFSVGPKISADGSTVAFLSRATNLVPGDGNGFDDIFVVDLATRAVELVSVAADGGMGDAPCLAPLAISADGRVVAFTSDAANLVVDDGNGSSDLFVRERAHAVTERVSLSSDEVEGDGDSYDPALSPDGRFVGFTSVARNLVAWDGNGKSDVFRRDRQEGATLMASGSCAGLVGNDESMLPALSVDGALVTFVSRAKNLAGTDTRTSFDLFLYDSNQDGPVAAWSSYGAGFPGRNGVIPALTASAPPERGTTIDVVVGNSSGLYTVAFLFVGGTRIDLPLKLGGSLLVAADAVVAIAVPPGEATLATEIPWDVPCGVIVDAQSLLLDPWAAKGVAFSAGLELLIGE